VNAKPATIIMADLCDHVPAAHEQEAHRRDETSIEQERQLVLVAPPQPLTRLLLCSRRQSARNRVGDVGRVPGAGTGRALCHRNAMVSSPGCRRLLATK
jgi:hypothetical protein